MDVMNGTVFGPYEIVAPIGAGGMGEVYRARDTRLDRQVAIKVLPRHLASSPELRLRFEREARAVSSLSHPHICALFDVGAHEGVQYLVMELLDGETLSDRLKRGPLPVDAAVRYGAEIASALDRAHRDGMIHRDLKPGNVMITRSGAKLLDFGLAKFTSSLAADVLLVAETEQKPITTEGTLLGTYQYMAPEQLEGKEADPRSDIFAFGAVLYEMITGRRPFEGKSRAGVVAAVLSQEPPSISSIQPLVPPALDRVIRTCLAKDPDDRWQTAHDVMLQLRWIAEGGSQVGAPAAVVSRRRLRERVAWASAAALVLALAAMSTIAWRQAQRTAPVMRVTLPAKTAQYTEAGLRILSPDGSFMIFAANDANGETRIWRQGIADAQASPIDGTKDARPASISPGGRSFLMYQRRKLVRVDFAGGAPVPLADIPEAWGGTWIDDATVVYADSDSRGLRRVPAAGGSPEMLLASSPKGEHLIWPEALPGGRSLLYVTSDLKSSGSYEKDLHVLDLKTKKTRRLMQVSTRTLYANGYLLTVRDGSLSATPFDPESLEVEGEPKLVSDGVENFKPRGDAGIAVSSSGLLSYETPTLGSEMRWLDRDGHVLGQLGNATRYTSPSISHDGTRVAAGVVEPKTGVPNLWVYGVARATRERLGFSERYENDAVWTPDRKWIIFHSDRADVPDLYRRAADGSGADELLYAAPGLQTPNAVSPDGRWLVFTNSLRGTSGADLMLLSLSDRKAQPWLQTPAHEANARFSRDGRWIAYTSNESGRTEIYVRPFPGPGEKIQISTGGGWAPRWSHDGRELLYLNDRTATSVAIRGNDFAVDEPRRLFTMPTGVNTWDLAPDGRILVLAVAEEVPHHPVQLIVNWPGLVK